MYEKKCFRCGFLLTGFELRHTKTGLCQNCDSEIGEIE